MILRRSETWLVAYLAVERERACSGIAAKAARMVGRYLAGSTWTDPHSSIRREDARKRLDLARPPVDPLVEKCSIRYEMISAGTQ
jgi:hypothetical protein